MPIYIHQLGGDGDGLSCCFSYIIGLHGILNGDVLILIKGLCE